MGGVESVKKSLNIDQNIYKNEDSLYSRQLLVLGKEAMQELKNNSILISGMNGLGVEIAKNIILGGVKSVTIHDDVLVSNDDLASQYYLCENDIGINRADSSYPHLQQLNQFVQINKFTKELSKEYIIKNSFQLIVFARPLLTEEFEIGTFCHKNGIKLIIAETYGIFGKVFCDFGPNFEIRDVDGRSPQKGFINSINEKSEINFFEKHELTEDDYIRLSDIEGMNELNGLETRVVDVINPLTIKIEVDTQNFEKFIKNGLAIYSKKPKTVKFLSLKDSISEPKFVKTELLKSKDLNSIHLAFVSLPNYIQKYGKYPKAWCKDDAEKFSESCLDMNRALKQPLKSINTEILKLFAYVCSGSLSPLNSFIGSIASQEVIKACSKKFHPIIQYLYFDCRECLPKDPSLALRNPENFEILNNECNKRYISQIKVFGKEFQKKLENAKYFLVGAGALGCEYLKNFAMIGLGCSKEGSIIVTDMDTIENHNLNRQFLFREKDIRSYKSIVAAKAVKSMNPNINITALTERVGKETEDTFSDSFFLQLDGICNALDNVDSRIYMDKKCVCYSKPLIESGTQGIQGSTMPILPFLTQSYSSIPSAPDTGIPMCTLRYFPTSIIHTIEWARDKFEGEFKNSIEDANNYLKSPSEYIERIKSFENKFDQLEKLYDLLVSSKPSNFEDCIIWARKKFQSDYNSFIKDLLADFPLDYIDSDGKPFWTNLKRCPHPIDFDACNPEHINYIKATANLIAEIYGIKNGRRRNTEVIVKSVNSVKVDPYKAKDATKEDFSNKSDIDFENLKKKLEENLKTKSLLNPIDFEKDDDDNLHIEFIMNCSNLRAENYKIDKADFGKTKHIAGRIIPAIATTTSAIVGLDCIELYKVIQGHKDLSMYRNTLINLSIPFFGLSFPIPVTKSKCLDKFYSIWDKFNVSKNETLKGLIELFKNEHKLIIKQLYYDSIETISLYYEGFEVEDIRLIDLVERELNMKLSTKIKIIEFAVMCSDFSDNDIPDLPRIRITL